MTRSNRMKFRLPPHQLYIRVFRVFLVVVKAKTKIPLPYFFVYKVQHFVNKSLLNSSKSVVISVCILQPGTFAQQSKIESNFLLSQL